MGLGTNLFADAVVAYKTYCIILCPAALFMGSGSLYLLTGHTALTPMTCKHGGSHTENDTVRKLKC